ncbi:MAG: methylated-DNA--[protein]-cysteine S-methyltransferase, partial [Thermoanaerobaculia bacterium]|nr:methylated-DNA--[protein]-cysteine S-methyltransferase [Thermoanaerobaculia bacterium]
MRCDDVEVRLDCFRSGELDQNEAAAIETHLETCPECCDVRDEIESIADSAKRLLGECRPCCLEALEDALFDRYDHFESERGAVHVAFSSKGVTRVRLGGTRESFADEYRQRFGRELHCSKIDEISRRAIISALEGAGGQEVGIDLTALSDFEQKVLRALLRIPMGEVRTYAWVAREAGNPAASRAVGNACARNPIPFVVPCHRVVPTSGGVGSYGYGPRFKRELLNAEGVATEKLEELSRRGIRYVGSREDHSYCFPTCRAVESIPEAKIVYFRGDDDAIA